LGKLTNFYAETYTSRLTRLGVSRKVGRARSLFTISPTKTHRLAVELLLEITIFVLTSTRS